MKKIKYKKGDEKWISIWWFLMAILVSGVFVFVTAYKYGKDIDVLEVQNKIINKKIFLCLVENNNLKPNFFNEDLYSYCKLNKNRPFYFKVSLTDENGFIVDEFESYARDYSIVCNLILNNEKNTEVKDAPHCYKEKKLVYYNFNGELKKGYLEVLTALKNEDD